MMFSGARQRKSLNLSVNDSGILDKTIEDKIEDVSATKNWRENIFSIFMSILQKLPATALGCNLCLNDIEKTSNSLCTACNLKVCEKCKDHCSYCSKNLCVNCINIFGCAVTIDDFITPICEDCRSYL